MNSGCYKKGNVPFNKGLKMTEYITSEEKMQNIKNHQFPNQIWTEMAIEEGRYLPSKAMAKGTIVRRVHIHKKGKNAGKVEIEYFINIDWRGNRKANTLYRRYLWEKEHQMDIPKGYVVYLRDQNPDNITLENLELITRSELVKRNLCKRK